MWNAKRKKWVYPFTQKGFIQTTVRQTFTDLKEEICDTKDFKSASKFVSRCLERLDRGEFDAEEKQFFLLMSVHHKKDVDQDLF